MNNVNTRVKNHFIPSPENDHKPYILRPRIIAFVLMVAMVAEFTFVFGSHYLIPRSKLYGIIEANALVDETNQSRTSNDIPTLQISALLQAAAQAKANDMASKGYFAHTSPQGLTPWYWFENVGYNFEYAGENLAVNFTDSKDVTAAWMNSPEHRANILSGDFTQIGIATAEGVYEGKTVTFVVEEFGTPTPAAAPVAFVNSASADSTPTTGPIAQVAAAPSLTKKIIAKKTVVVKKPVIKNATSVVITVVPMQNTSTASSVQNFISVKGARAESQNIPAAAATVSANPVRQSNWAQMAFSDPKRVANDFYLFLMVLFSVALVLNIFIKIRIQYPRLIASGLAVIIISGLCIMLNQNIGLLHAAIL